MGFRLEGLWQRPDFMKFWAGQTISVIGSSITALALPLIATLTLDATPAQMGVLVALGHVAYLIVGLPAGAWIDRTRRRPILIAADIGRTLVLASVPAAALLGFLRMEYLYAVALVAGVMTVFFELAYLAFLPVLVSREHIVEANAKLETSRSAAQIAGPGLAGLLIQWIGAPLALVVDALSFAMSAVSLMLVRVEETLPEDTGSRPALWQDIGEGIRTVLHNPLLRTLTAGVSIFNGFAGMVEAILVLFVARELQLEAAAIGVMFSLAGPGSLIGALLARRITEWVGMGPAVVFSLLISSIAMFLIPLAQPPELLAISMIAVSYAITGACVMIFNINVLSLRQSITPDRLLGRVGATQRFVVLGVLPLGSLLGGVLGGQIGLRPTLFAAAAGMLLSGVVLMLSPVRRLKRPQEAIEQYGIE